MPGYKHDSSLSYSEPEIIDFPLLQNAVEHEPPEPDEPSAA